MLTDKDEPQGRITAGVPIIDQHYGPMFLTYLSNSIPQHDVDTYLDPFIDPEPSTQLSNLESRPTRAVATHAHTLKGAGPCGDAGAGQAKRSLNIP